MGRDELLGDCRTTPGLRRGLLGADGGFVVGNLLDDAVHEFRRHKALADKAMGQLNDEQFFCRPAPQVNSVAIIVKHLAGNLLSRWTDFLNTDGEKPTRDRDGEFLVADNDTREKLLAAWEQGWQAVLDSVAGLTEADLNKSITIRGERHTVVQAMLRGMTHAAYHVGQILYLCRLMAPDSEWLTIAPGKSTSHQGVYRKSP
jgi:hypothetical protein